MNNSRKKSARESPGKRSRLNRWFLFLLFPALLLLATGPAIGAEQSDQDPSIERGKPVWALDAFANLLAIPKKIILLNPKVENHRVSEKTEQIVRGFFIAYPNQTRDLKVRFNQWTPVGEFKRLIQNKRIEWYFRVFPGIPTTLWSSFTGRLLGGDHYNPYTNTVNLFSDDPAIALHELGHAKDFAEQAQPGYYALGRILPPVTLHQEQVASDTAIQYLKDKQDRAGELHVYSTLYPAFGTYAGEEFGLPYGSYAGAAVGHVLGFRERQEKKLGYQALDEARVLDTPPRQDALSDTLVRRQQEERRLLLHHLSP